MVLNLTWTTLVYHYSDKIMFNQKLSKLLGVPNRLPEEPINDIHKNISKIHSTHMKNIFLDY